MEDLNNMKFRVGDRVKVLKFASEIEYNPEYIGKQGVIVKIDDYTYPYEIRFDEEKLNDDCIYWNEEEIELVNVAEKNLDLFNKWYGNFKEACKEVGI